MPPIKLPHNNILKVYSSFLKSTPGQTVLINGHIEDHSVEIPCREYGFDKTRFLKCATVSIKQL